MPEYTFQCDQEDNGCGHIFSIVCPISKYSPKQKCPQCKKTKPVHREYLLDNLTGNIIKGDEQITLGHLADRNRSRYSHDQKLAMYQENTRYLWDKPPIEDRNIQRFPKPKELPPPKTRTRPPNKDLIKRRRKDGKRKRTK